MRGFVRNEFAPVIAEAARVARAAINTGGAGPTRQPPALPQAFTTTGVDENGDAVFQYPAMTELDSTESGAMTSS
jgi:hypothetical protein